jgi:hypothetical protein
VDDLVAVRARTDAGQVGFWLTWGRLFGPFDPTAMIAAIRPHLRLAEQRGEIDQVQICDSLQEASDQPYFYKGLWWLGQTRIPFGPGYEEWAAEKRPQLADGRGLFYLGDHDRDARGRE